MFGTRHLAIGVLVLAVSAVPGWKDAKVANQLQIMSVILLAGALKEVEQKAP